VNIKKKGLYKMKHIPDLLWCELEKLIPKNNLHAGRPEFDNRKAFNGIAYVLKTGIQWNLLPEKYGCPTTVHGKFMRWCRAGVFHKLIIKTRSFYQRRNSKNIWYAFDVISKKAPLANFSGKNPTDRAKRGIKHAILVDRKGAPLDVIVTSANKHDSKLFEPALSLFRKSKNTRIIAADSAFDVKRFYKLSKKKNIALIASPNPRRNKNKHKFNVPHRWIVEQTLGILVQNRGLKICWAKTFKSSLAFIQIACSIRMFQMI
jgi:transposase